jgi:hypothetical protein
MTCHIGSKEKGMGLGKSAEEPDTKKKPAVQHRRLEKDD